MSDLLQFVLEHGTTIVVLGAGIADRLKAKARAEAAAAAAVEAVLKRNAALEERCDVLETLLEKAEARTAAAVKEREAVARSANSGHTPRKG